MNDTPNWNAAAFFKKLTASNRLAVQKEFRFCKVSGLEGFEAAVTDMKAAKAFVCVSDSSEGYTDLDNTPHSRRIKTVFLAMRHKVADMEARDRCLDIMRELFRQFMSVLIQEKTKLQQGHIYIDQRISFTEIDRYFFSGAAGAYFQIAVDKYVDLRYDPDEWFPESI